MEKYCPGATDRILKMQERVADMVVDEQAHQHEMDRANSRRKTNGQRYAFLAFLICMAITVWAASAVNWQLASVIGGSTVVGIVGIFAAGRKTRDGDVESRDAGGDRLRE
jgi:uncharacterized membrane protein